MFGKKQQIKIEKKFQPKIEFDGRNFIRIRGLSDENYQYIDNLIDQGYTIVAGGGLDMSVIILNKPITLEIKSEQK